MRPSRQFGEFFFFCSGGVGGVLSVFTHILTARSLSIIWFHELVVEDIVGRDYKDPH